MENEITKKILQIISKSHEPLETKEVEKELKGVSRSKILYRLNDLRGEGKIKGKHLGPGKGVWIWWRVGALK
jgi:DNA-binding Lrp family transcriptional regulator